MLKSYIRIAFRNLVRNKLFSTLNILGLAIGMGSAILILLWVNDELQVDQFHANGPLLYRVMENQQYTDGKLFTFSSTPGPMAPFIKDKYPEIEKASRFSWEVNNLFTLGDKTFYDRGRYADQDFLDMFSFQWVSGNQSSALKDKHSIVMNETMAEKYFGKENPIGKTITMNTDENFTVTGVFKSLTKQSSFQYDYLLCFQYFFDENKSWLDQWGNNNIRTFIQLTPGTQIDAFQKKFENEIKEHEAETNVKLFVQPYQDMYLYGNFENGKQTGGRIEFVRIFSVVAVFVLLIACINFMNLSTAQAGKRAKEVGLRKVAGAFPSQLFRQFMGESFVTVGISAVLAVGIVLLTLSSFNELTGKTMSLMLFDKDMALILVGVIVVTSLVAGSYPAFVIAEFKPVQVLKGQLKSGSGAFFFRKVLVVTQFFLSILGIISTIVVFRQMNYMQNREIGFVRDNLFYVWMDGDVHAKFETFKNRLSELEGVESITASTQLPIDIGNSTYGLQWEGKDPNERILFTNMDVDADFIQTMKMRMAEGRAFDRNQISDTMNYIVNEVAAKKFGFKSGTAGQEITMWESKGKIIGVVKDFNFGSLHRPIEPLIIRYRNKYVSCLVVRAKANESEAALRSTEKLWKEYAPGYPFKYSFLNQDWENFYKSEQQRGKVFNAMSAISIFISCLGLFGLSAFSAERRTKELGIRKVLGASTNGLVALMGKEFAVLVLVASALGCPLGWYFMDNWLKGYAFHIEVGWGTLAFAVLFCITIAMLTVSYHAIRVALANPAKAMRYE